MDMVRAYDRVDWSFLIKLLEKIGFDKVVVDMIYRILASNYSILINGQSYVFFNSTRGEIKRPFIPYLIVLVEEVLARAPNLLFDIEKFKDFGVPNRLILITI